MSSKDVLIKLVLGEIMRMQGRHTGIVLKTGFPKRWGVALVDFYLGRMNGLVLSRELSHGLLISYELSPRGGGDYARLDHVRIENAPLALAAHDLLFLHHVLELCYEFIPVGSCVTGVFDLLLFLYSTDNRGWNDARKLLFLFKLLVSLGTHPEGSLLNELQVARLTALPFEHHDMIAYVTSHQSLIKDWLGRCVAEHPRAKEFKTTRFLMRD